MNRNEIYKSYIINSYIKYDFLGECNARIIFNHINAIFYLFFIGDIQIKIGKFEIKVIGMA